MDSREILRLHSGIAQMLAIKIRQGERLTLIEEAVATLITLVSLIAMGQTTKKKSKIMTKGEFYVGRHHRN